MWPVDHRGPGMARTSGTILRVYWSSESTALCLLTLQEVHLWLHTIWYPKAPLWHDDYFELKTNQGRKDTKRNVGFSTYLPKIYTVGKSVPRREQLPEISAKKYGLGPEGKTWAGPRSELTLWPIVSLGPRKHSFINRLLFHPQVYCLPSLWCPKLLFLTSSCL